jgi:hypothetical protein
MSTKEELIYGNQFKTLLKEKFPQLTESDLQHDEGMEENMLRMIEYKLRKTKEEMQQIISNLSCSA